jgi:hypothetical protein
MNCTALLIARGAVARPLVRRGRLVAATTSVNPSRVQTMRRVSTATGTSRSSLRIVPNASTYQPSSWPTAGGVGPSRSAAASWASPSSAASIRRRAVRAEHPSRMASQSIRSSNWTPVASSWMPRAASAVIRSSGESRAASSSRRASIAATRSRGMRRCATGHDPAARPSMRSAVDCWSSHRGRHQARRLSRRPAGTTAASPGVYTPPPAISASQIGRILNEAGINPTDAEPGTVGPTYAGCSGPVGRMGADRVRSRR